MTRPRRRQKKEGARRPEHELLSAVVLALGRHVPVVAPGYFPDAPQPFPVGGSHAVETTEPDEHGGEEDDEDETDVGMHDACPDAAPEKLGEGPEKRMEEGKARQGYQDKTNRDDPVVRPLGGRVAPQVLRIAHHLASSSFLTSSSASFETSFGPFTT